MKYRRLKIFLQELTSDKLAALSFICIVLIILSAVLAFLAPYDPNKIDIHNMLANPSMKHLFGTDNLGRDYFSRALYGARVSLEVGFWATLISSIIGIIFGTFSGYLNGVLDFALMRITEIFLAVPFLIVVTVLLLFMKPGVFSLSLIIGMFLWMPMARLIRAETLSLKEREYVYYAKASGAGTLKIILKHIFPGVYPVFILTATLNIAGAIMSESTLSFLGLGIKPPNSSLGTMISTGQNNLTTNPYLSLIPGLIIFLLILSINKIGQVIRIALEPRSGIDN